MVSLKPSWGRDLILDYNGENLWGTVINMVLHVMV